MRLASHGPGFNFQSLVQRYWCLLLHYIGVQWVPLTLISDESMHGILECRTLPERTGASNILANHKVSLAICIVNHSFKSLVSIKLTGWHSRVETQTTQTMLWPNPHGIESWRFSNSQCTHTPLVLLGVCTDEQSHDQLRIIGNHPWTGI